MRPVLFAALFALAASAACHAPRGPMPAEDAEGGVTIKIVNHNALDVVLYVVHDSYRERIGQVTGSTESSFPLPFRTLGAGREFQLLADPIGFREPVRSEIIHPQDGQTITWTLESDFARSHVQVF